MVLGTSASNDRDISGENFGRKRGNALAGGAQVTDKVHCAGNVHLLLFGEASAHTLCGRRVIAYYPERCAGLTGSSAPIKCTTVPARVTCPQCASALNRPAEIRIRSENKANGRDKTHAHT
jgi:hypothetical protein